MMDDEGSKNDFGPAKPKRAKQTRPVEALILFTASAVFSYGASHIYFIEKRVDMGKKPTLALRSP